MVEYIYDGLGDRVAKGNISTFSCDQTSNGFTVTNNYIYGENGQQLAEYDGSGNIVHENVHQGGNLLATYTASTSKWLYAFNDWLGTKRAQVGPDGSTNFLGFTSLPYGDNLSMSGVSATEDHFTGKDRDPESGNDYFGARYYSSKVGRWMSPDWADKPEAVPYSSLDNPQSLNLYGYVLNNPLSHADSDGHCCESDFNSFSDHPGQMVGPSTATDKQISGAILSGLSLVFPPAAVLQAAGDFSSGHHGAAALDLAGAIPVGEMGADT